MATDKNEVMDKLDEIVKLKESVLCLQSKVEVLERQSSNLRGEILSTPQRCPTCVYIFSPCM